MAHVETCVGADGVRPKDRARAKGAKGAKNAKKETTHHKDTKSAKREKTENRTCLKPRRHERNGNEGA